MPEYDTQGYTVIHDLRAGGSAQQGIGKELQIEVSAVVEVRNVRY